MNKIPLICVDRAFKDQVFHLELSKDAAILHDPLGQVIDVISVEAAPRRFTLPSFSQSIKYLSIDSNQGVLRFSAHEADLERVRRFVEQEITRGGSPAINRHRKWSMLKIIVGPALAAFGVLASIASFNAASPAGGTYTVHFGLVIFGLIIFGEGIYQLSRNAGMQRAGTDAPDAFFDPETAESPLSRDPSTIRRPVSFAKVLLLSVAGVAIAAVIAVILSLPPSSPSPPRNPPVWPSAPASGNAPVGQPVDPNARLANHPAMAAGFVADEALIEAGDGLRTRKGQFLWTREAGFLNKDFDLEMVFETPADGWILYAGIAPSQSDRTEEPRGGVIARIHRPGLAEGYVEVSRGVGDSDGFVLGHLQATGPHQLRISKRGPTIKWSLDVDYDGKEFIPDKTGMLYDVGRYQTELTNDKARLVYGGAGVWKSVSLKVYAPSDADISPFERHPALPQEFLVNLCPVVADDGLRMERRHLLRTQRSGYLNKDFDLDMEFQSPPDGWIMYAGIGPGVRSAGSEPHNGVYVRMHRPGLDEGRMVVTRGPGDDTELTLGRLEGNGPHRLLISKRGVTMKWALDIDHDGKEFKPDKTGMIFDVTKYQRELTADNSFLYFGGAGLWNRVTLTVHDPSDAPAASFGTHPALPPEFVADLGPVLVDDGMRTESDHLIRSLQSDHLNKDFDFDLVFETLNNGQVMFAGIGPGPRSGGREPMDGVVARIHRPGLADGNVSVSRGVGDRATLLGHLETHGPHMLRVSKRGLAVTWSLDMDYDGKEFKPERSHTIEDLAKYQPALTAENARLLYGGSGIWKSVSLTILEPAEAEAKEQD